MTAHYTDPDGTDGDRRYDAAVDAAVAMCGTCAEMGLPIPARHFEDAPPYGATDYYCAAHRPFGAGDIPDAPQIVEVRVWAAPPSRARYPIAILRPSVDRAGDWMGWTLRGGAPRATASRLSSKAALAALGRHAAAGNVVDVERAASERCPCGDLAYATTGYCAFCAKRRGIPPALHLSPTAAAEVRDAPPGAGALGPAPGHDCLLPMVCGERDPISRYYGFSAGDDTIRCANAPEPPPEEPPCRACENIGALCPAHEGH